MVTPEEVEAAHKAMTEFQYGNSFDPDMDPVGWSLDQLEAGLEAAKREAKSQKYVAFMGSLDDEGR